MNQVIFARSLQSNAPLFPTWSRHLHRALRGLARASRQATRRFCAPTHIQWDGVPQPGVGLLTTYHNSDACQRHRCQLYAYGQRNTHAWTTRYVRVSSRTRHKFFLCNQRQKRTRACSRTTICCSCRRQLPSDASTLTNACLAHHPPERRNASPAVDC
eukprot:1644884-Pleurochrysis_carterae.AAC.1